MKQLTTSVAIALLLSITSSFGQQADTTQVKTGERFLQCIMKGQNEDAWKLLDTVHITDVTREQFFSAITQIKNDLSVFDSFALELTGIKMIDTQELKIYSFKAFSNTKTVVDEIMVDLLFFKNSNLVAGIQPKKLMKENAASTTKAKETPLENTFQATIEGTSYTITGINIVHFENDKALLTIQIVYNIPNDVPDMQAWGHKEGIKFAMYLINNGYLNKAKLKAKELKRTLLPDIGVSFFEPGVRGFNVMLNPKEYNQ